MAQAKKYAYELETPRIFELIKQRFQEHQFHELNKELFTDISVKLCSHEVLKANV